MRANKLRELLTADRPIIGTRIHSTWPPVIEAIGHTGLYDYVEFVAEYTPFDLHDFDNLCRTVELFDMSSMIKMDREPRGFMAQRAIGSGFQSVLFANCRTADDVRDCVRFSRPDTPQDGGTYGAVTRRFGYMGYGGGEAYMQAIRDVVVVMMIEKKSAVDQLEEILEIDGVDMIQFGGADYSMSVGKVGPAHRAEIKKAEKYVLETALKMGVPPRVEIESPDQARAYLDMGIRHFNLGTDLSILYKFWQREGTALSEIMNGDS